MAADFIGRRVAAYRAAAGVTQGQLAERAGVDRTYVAHIEAGRRAVASRHLLISLAEALGVSTSDLTANLPHARSKPEQEVHDAVPQVRAALDGVEESEPLPADRLSADVDTLMRARMACDYRALGGKSGPRR